MLPGDPQDFPKDGTCQVMHAASLNISTRGFGTSLRPSTSTGCTIGCLDNWGFRGAGARNWRKESIEEMEHADKIMERIIFLDGFPNLQVLDPLHIGQNVEEVLDCRSRRRDVGARALSRRPPPDCHAVQDYVTRDLFEKLMHDEEEHIDFLETQLGLVAKLGVEL